MKKQLWISMLLLASLNAGKVEMTAEQEQSWQITLEEPQRSDRMPLGDFVATVVTPPSLLHTISLPFEAIVKKLNVAKYQTVPKGYVLAEVTGTKWIEIQQKAIADAIEFRHHQHLTERKNMLCKEEIIPQKECVAANAELETDKIKVAASKALLESYGASDETISKLFKELKLSPTIQIKSTVAGSIVELHATPGKSTSPMDALFIIQEKGPLWLESNIEAHRTEVLHEGEKVEIDLDEKRFEATVLQIAPVINPENQTRQVRFSVPMDAGVVSGQRNSVRIILFEKSLKVRKSSVIKQGDTQIVFTKTSYGFIAVPVTILAEGDNNYYLKPNERLKAKIAVNSVAILKNMLGESDE